MDIFNMNKVDWYCVRKWKVHLNILSTFIEAFGKTFISNHIKVSLASTQPNHLEVCLPISRLLSGLIGMWSSMKITLIHTKNDLANICLIHFYKRHGVSWCQRYFYMIADKAYSESFNKCWQNIQMNFSFSHTVILAIHPLD